MKFQIVKITPEQAEKWLKRNKSNRRISAARVEAYARDMDNGKWLLTPQGITLDSKDNVLDGQHRLEAIILHGKPVEMVVFRDVSPNVREVLDRGRARTVADYLRMSGVTKHVVLQAAMARGLNNLDNGTTSGVFTTSDAKTVMKKYAKAFEWLQETIVVSGLATGPYLSAIAWSLPLGDVVDDFHRKVMLGVELKAKSPELALRNVLTNARLIGVNKTADTYMKVLNCVAAAFDKQPILRNVYPSTVGYKRIAQLTGRSVPEGELTSKRIARQVKIAA
jgi:hypothetical protein